MPPANSHQPSEPSDFHQIDVREIDEQITRPNPAVIEALEQCPGGVTVLGAGGKMGYHVCRMLQRSLAILGREHELVAVSRFGSEATLAKFTQTGISTIAADLSNPEDVAKVPCTPNVFFLAGIKFGTSTRGDLLHRMNVRMPQLVADHFTDSRIVVMSTGCVYSFSDPASGGSKESDPTEPPGDYAKSCLARENAFIAGSKTHGSRCVLIRLNYSIDLRYGVLVDLAKQVHQKVPINVDTGYVNVIWQGDAVQQILRSLPLAKTPPLVLNITGRETHSVRDLAKRIGQRFDCAPTFVGQEADRCWLNNSTQAEKLFGKPATSTDQMIDWIVDWITRGGPTLDKPTHFQNRNGVY